MEIQILYNAQKIDIARDLYDIVWLDIDIYRIYYNVATEKGFNSIIEMLTYKDENLKKEAYYDVKLDTYNEIKKILDNTVLHQDSIILITFDDIKIQEIVENFTQEDIEADARYISYFLHIIRDEDMFVDIINYYLKERQKITLEIIDLYRINTPFFIQYDSKTFSFSKSAVLVANRSNIEKEIPHFIFENQLNIEKLILSYVRKNEDINLMISTNNKNHVILSRIITRELIQRLSKYVLIVPKEYDMRLYMANLKNNIREVFKNSIKDVQQVENENGITIYIPLERTDKIYI